MPFLNYFLNKKVRTQMIIGFVLVIVLSIIITSIPTVMNTALTYQNSTKQQLAAGSKSTATLISDIMHEQSDFAKILSENPMIRQAATHASTLSPMTL